MVLNDEDLGNGAISHEKTQDLSYIHDSDYAKNDKNLDLGLFTEKGSNDDLEEFMSDDLLKIINECNEALKELKDARNKLESQLEESHAYCKEPIESEKCANEIVKSSCESFESDENINDLTEANYDTETLYNGSDAADFENMTEFNECELSSEGEAINSLTSNLEKLQSEIDSMIEELMKDEQAAMLAINEFMESCDTKSDENKDEILNFEACKPQA